MCDLLISVVVINIMLVFMWWVGIISWTVKKSTFCSELARWTLSKGINVSMSIHRILRILLYQISYLPVAATPSYFRITWVVNSSSLKYPLQKELSVALIVNNYRLREVIQFNFHCIFFFFNNWVTRKYHAQSIFAAIINEKICHSNTISIYKWLKSFLWNKLGLCQFLLKEFQIDILR